MNSQDVYFHLEELFTQKEVIQIEQEQNGILWLLTSNELISYNGYEQLSFAYNLVDTMVFSSFAITSDKALIGSENGQILIFDIELKEWLEPLDYSFNASITQISEIGADELMVSTYGDGITKLNLKDLGNATTYQSSDFIYEFIVVEQKGYLATDDGVFEIDLISYDSSRLIYNGIIPYIEIRDQNELWFVDYDKGLIRLSLTNNDQEVFAIDEIGMVHSLSISEHNELIGTNNGLYELRDNGLFNQWQDPENLLRNVDQIFIDDENDLWIYDSHTGFWKGALNFKTLESEIDYEIQTTLLKNGRLLLGTEIGLYTGEIDHWNPQLAINDINVTSCISQGGYCFIGTYNKGIYVLDEYDRIIKQINMNSGLAENAILDISMIDDSRIQISTLAGVQELSGLTDELSSWKLARPIEGLSRNYVLDIFSDGSSIYYGLDKSGLKVLGQNEMLALNETDHHLALGSIYSIAQSSDKTIWLSSEELGVVKMEDDKIVDWKSPHGLDQVCYSIIPLEKNHLIFVGEESIDIYDINNHELLEYDIEIGLNKHQNYLNNYSLYNDQVWISHGNNLFKYEQSRSKHRTVVNTVMDKVEVNLDHIELNQTTFSQNENNFTFYYSGILHRNTKRIYYSYQLVGFDEQWRTTQDRYVSYPHLAPGNYEFRIKASHDEFSPPSNYLSYEFKISRAFYNSIWFWTVLALLGIALVYYWIRRSARERALQIELDQKKIETQLINLKSQLNPHFMFNSFNTMIGLIEEDKNRGIEFIEHLTDFYRGVLEIGEAELIDVEKEIELLRHYIHLLKERFGAGIDIRFESDLKRFKVPPLSLQMLIENAVKHNVVSDQKPLVVAIFIESDKLVVENNKQLKTAANTSFGIGLENLKRRYQILSGRAIEVLSNESIFAVKLPIIHY